MYNKNDVVKLRIVDMSDIGLGIAKIDSQVFFVKDAIIGDYVEAIVTKVGSINYAKVKKVIEVSKYRVKPECPYAEKCGGCQIMSMSYDRQLLLKETIVKKNLHRIGELTEKSIGEKFEGIIGMDEPYTFRNKMQIPFAVRNDRVIAGFYAGRTHHIVENDKCITGFDEAATIIDIIKKLCIVDDVQNKKYNKKRKNEENDEENFCGSLSVYDEETGEGVLREVMLRKGNKSNEISITLIVNDKKLEEDIKRKGYVLLKDIADNTKTLQKKHKANMYKYLGIAQTIVAEYDKMQLSNTSKIVTITLNVNTEENNVLFGKDNVILYGNGFIEDKIDDLTFRIAPQSFYQVNNVQTEKLYKTILEFGNFSKDERVMDLYCGIGTITLFVARNVKSIMGMDIVEEAIINARDNAKINNINNADFYCLDLSEEIPLKVFLETGTIIVDPPRKGIDITTLLFIRNIAPKKILYVSCDSATLARDISILCDKREKVYYTVERIKCVDMFPHTMHVETVALMNKV